MDRIQGELVSSATDLANYMGCKHAVALDKRCTEGELEKPYYHNPTLDALKEHGRQHEASYLKHLKEEGKTGVCLPDSAQRAELLRAMEAGPNYIYQARLELGGWRGIADFLIKSYKPSNLGDWSYEVLDAKLARETRGETILQLCVYSELLADLQGVWPDYAYVLTPASLRPESYRLAEYTAYYRLVKKNYAAFVTGAENAGTYPDPVEKCDRCDWFSLCDKRRREDDHLGFVAGISRLQREELRRQTITTMAQLAEQPTPLPFASKKGNKASLERIRAQASLQHTARQTDEPQLSILPLEEGQGVYLLPEPSPGDIHFDIEGARFVGDEGLEYLFGFATFDDAGNLLYEKLIANTPKEEKQLFDAFMQRMDEIQQAHPDMHIYHFRSYEPSALKRLAGGYAMHEDLLEFYRREDKSTYWEKFRLSDLDDIDRLSERSAIAGLEYLETVDKSKTGISTDRFHFPTQDITIKPGDALYIDSESNLGTVAAIDHEHQTVDIKKMGKTKDLAPASVFTWKRVGSPEQEAALVRLAGKVLTGDTDTLEMQQLRRSLPVLTTGQSLQEVRAEIADEQALALHAITRIENQVLGIQGPPGTGKTHTGAQMMLAAVRAGMKIGVTGLSHKVIINFLQNAITFARDEGSALRIVRKTGSDDDDEASAADPMIEALNDNDAVEAAIRGDAQIAAGTAWLWAREHMINTVDVLFIDEAGQFSLANTCAVAQAANAMVLLGDPQQLDQPLKGTHRPGGQASGLQHMLGNNTTMPKERGLFLPASWRMHPNVCEYICPYNAQLGEIKKQNHAINVGTVDKFQGQQAPVVIISYATSTPEEAPRGMDFLYSLKRLNVAVSRAKCAVFLVCSPALVEPGCKKPGQMRLANGLARYVECSLTASQSKEPDKKHAG